MTDIEVTKSGEEVARITVGRGKTYEGIQVTVWASERLESFMKSLGDRLVTADSICRGWIPVNHPLEVYQMNEPLVTGELGFVLDRIGKPLLYDVEDGGRLSGSQQITNLAFLRLVGISREAGVFFGIKGLYPQSHIDKLTERLGQGIKTFYREFMKPTNQSIHLLIEGR